MALKTPLQGDGNVVALPVRPLAAVRTPTVIAAEIRVHTDAIKLLTAELIEVSACGATAPAKPAGQTEEVLSLQRASFAIGWERQRLLRHIVRHNSAHPNDRIAYQPGGVRNSPWQVPMDRLRRYIRDLPAGAESHAAQP